MERLNDILVNLLKTDSRYFTDEGELLKNAVYEDAMKMDSSLIKLLKYIVFLKKKEYTKIPITNIDDIIIIIKPLFFNFTTLLMYLV